MRSPAQREARLFEVKVLGRALAQDGQAKSVNEILAFIKRPLLLEMRRRQRPVRATIYAWLKVLPDVGFKVERLLVPRQTRGRCRVTYQVTRE